MNVTQRLQQLLGWGQDAGDTQDGAGPGGPGGRPPSAAGRSTDGRSRAGDATGGDEGPDRPDDGVQLFRCENCDTTYISEAMAECPECGTTTETTPSERDLGLL